MLLGWWYPSCFEEEPPASRGICWLPCVSLVVSKKNLQPSKPRHREIRVSEMRFPFLPG